MDVLSYFFTGQNFWQVIIFFIVLNVITLFIASRIMIARDSRRNKDKNGGKL